MFFATKSKDFALLPTHSLRVGPKGGWHKRWSELRFFLSGFLCFLRPPAKRVAPKANRSVVIWTRGAGAAGAQAVGFYLPPLGIGDDILEEEIRETLGIETGEISDANLRTIQSLTLRGAVSSIRGIEQLTNLRNFSVTGVRATLNDISPLSDLFRLREVSIFNTELTSLQGLFQLRLLRRLRLDANRIEDLWPLGRLTGVNDMSLGTNQIRDVFPLRRLIRMVKLNLNNNEIRDLGPLVKLINLEELNFNRNEVSSLAFIANMQKLRVLNCSTNLIEDISPLLDLPALTRVSLQGNPLSEEAKAHARELTDRGVTVIGSR